MRFTILVLTPPECGDANARAAAFVGQLLEAGHDLACVFFHDAGVLTGLNASEAPQDEADVRDSWTQLAQDRGARLIACVASAARHGVASEAVPGRLAAGFEIGGLGELVEASAVSDRLLTFAG